MTATEVMQDIVLFANDLGEFVNMPEGKAVSEAWYNDDVLGDYDMPESMMWANEIDTRGANFTELKKALNAYWEARNG